MRNMKTIEADRRLRKAFAQAGLDVGVFEFSVSTRTAEDAANAIGCAVSDIGKSLVFVGTRTTTPYVVVACGEDRIDAASVAREAGEPVRMATAKEVKSMTGYAIGGVPPLGHSDKIITLIDEKLLAKERIWVAAGLPRAVFPIAPGELMAASRGRAAHVVVAPPS